MAAATATQTSPVERTHPRRQDTESVLGPVCTVNIPWQARSVADVRRTLGGDLTARDLDPSLVAEAQLVVSELATNSVRHARSLADGTVRVRWMVGADSVEIHVTDGGGGDGPQVLAHAPWQVTGRGLWIVRSIAEKWGVTRTESGVTVWASLGCSPSRPAC